MIIFLLMNGIVVVSSFLITYRVFKLAERVDSLICWFLLYFAQIVLVETALGFFGILTLRAILGAILALFFVVWLVVRRRVSSFDRTGIREAGAAVVGDKVVLFGLSVIAGFALIKIYEGLFINPPLGWDCFTYHFVFPIEWIKHGNLENPIYIANDLSAAYYPFNGSLYFLWLMMPLKNVFLANMGQVPFYGLAFLATYAVARKVRLKRSSSIFAAILLTVTPNFFKQMQIGYVDVMMAALFLAAVNFLLLFYRENKFKFVVLWSLSFGLFIGLKPTGLTFGIGPFLFFILIAARIVGKKEWGRALGYVIASLLIIAAMGGYAYLRNFIRYGNPLFPTDITVLGKHIFKGVISLSRYRASGDWAHFTFKEVLFSEGLGAQFIIFIIGGLFLSAYVFLKKRPKRIDLPVFFLLSLPVTLYLAFHFLTPLPWVRYLYAFLATGFIASLCIIDMAGIPAIVIRWLVVICVTASTFELNRRNGLCLSLAASAILFFLLPRIAQYRFNKRLVAAICVMLAISLGFLNARYDKDEFKRYMAKSRFPDGEKAAWLWLRTHTGASRIAYTGRPDTLPLYGKHFTNDVFYVSVNKIHPARLHLFPSSHYIWTDDFSALRKNMEEPGNFREYPDYDDWRRNLELERIDFFVAYSVSEAKEGTFPIEDEWAIAHPEYFARVFTSNIAHMYKVNYEQ